jgi:hypothetical protein
MPSQCRSTSVRETCKLDRETIFIALLDEGTDVWRPVEAIRVGNGVYEIPADISIPADEHWPFSPGQVVACEARKFADGTFGLAAVRPGSR